MKLYKFREKFRKFVELYSEHRPNGTEQVCYLHSHSLRIFELDCRHFHKKSL